FLSRFDGLHDLRERSIAERSRLRHMEVFEAGGGFPDIGSEVRCLSVVPDLRSLRAVSDRGRRFSARSMPIQRRTCETDVLVRGIGIRTCM
ncbi:MAG: hypothetical protein OXG18_07855, partial [Gemmatimonadetes bacterium]|nr:hypothetical protein [Gemmatimonadota bacterium]